MTFAESCNKNYEISNKYSFLLNNRFIILKFHIL